MAGEIAQPSADTEDEEIPQPSSPVSPPVAAAPSEATDVTTELTEAVMDKETSMLAPSSPVSSPVSVDADDTAQPSTELGDNYIADLEGTTKPTNIDLQPVITPTANSPSAGEMASKRDETLETAAAAGSPKWRTSRGAILVESGFALFSSALSGDGFTIALEYKDEQGNARVQAHRYGLDGSWMQLGTDITGIGHLGGASNRLALSGDGKILAIGFPVENSNIRSLCGLVRVFAYKADDWKQLGNDIAGESSFGYLGLTVDILDDGMTVATGALFSHGASGNHVGMLRVFRYDTAEDSWEQLGHDLEGEAAWDYAGHGVAISADGTILAYGALQNLAGRLGYVKVFAYNQSVDSVAQLGEKLESDDSESKLGSAVSLSSDGSTLVVGAVKESRSGGDHEEVDVASSFGLVSVYRNGNDSWVKIGNDINSGSTGDLFGFSVATSADGNRVIIGALEDDSRLGSVSVFNLKDGTWTLQGQSLEYIFARVGGVPNELGLLVSISCSGLVVSAGGWFGVEIFEDSLPRAAKLDFGSTSPSRISSLTSGSVTGSTTMAPPTGY
jgi:hypothetical protein